MSEAGMSSFRLLLLCVCVCVCAVSFLLVKKLHVRNRRIGQTRRESADDSVGMELQKANWRERERERERAQLQEQRCTSRNFSVSDSLNNTQQTHERHSRQRVYPGCLFCFHLVSCCPLIIFLLILSVETENEKEADG